ncbi:MAG: hypothetical protein AB8B55_13775 [Mariniblastus sp.]
MSDPNFFILSKGKRYGPFALEQIKTMRDRGDCDALTRISTIQAPEAWQTLDSFLKQQEYDAAQPAPIEPPPMTDLETERAALVRPFPIFPMLLLHALTLGIFTFFWLLSRHGVLPKFRADDPSPAKAIFLCFVPFFNLYWIIVAFVRLVDRVNQFSRTLGIAEKIPRALAIIVAVLYLLPLGLGLIGLVVWGAIMFSPDPPSGEASFLFFQLPHLFTIISYLIAMPIFASMIQSRLNLCFEKQIEQLANQR